MQWRLCWYALQASQQTLHTKFIWFSHWNRRGSGFFAFNLPPLPPPSLLSSLALEKESCRFSLSPFFRFLSRSAFHLHFRVAPWTLAVCRNGKAINWNNKLCWTHILSIYVFGDAFSMPVNGDIFCCCFLLLLDVVHYVSIRANFHQATCRINDDENATADTEEFIEESEGTIYLHKLQIESHFRKLVEQICVYMRVSHTKLSLVSIALNPNWNNSKM